MAQTIINTEKDQEAGAEIAGVPLKQSTLSLIWKNLPVILILLQALIIYKLISYIDRMHQEDKVEDQQIIIFYREAYKKSTDVLLEIAPKYKPPTKSRSDEKDH